MSAPADVRLPRKVVETLREVVDFFYRIEEEMHHCTSELGEPYTIHTLELGHDGRALQARCDARLLLVLDAALDERRRRGS